MHFNANTSERQQRRQTWLYGLRFLCLSHKGRIILKKNIYKQNKGTYYLELEMENYYKGKNIEEVIGRDDIPIKDLPQNFLWMQVKGGSKMTNLLSHAAGILEDKASTAVVWTGAGAAVAKAVSCAEILKRQFSIEHQVTKLTFKKVEEYWEPKIDGLETIIVKRQIPIIHILLSLESLDSNQSGYQSIHGRKFWQCPSTNNTKQQQNYKSKKPFKHKNNK